MKSAIGRCAIWDGSKLAQIRRASLGIGETYVTAAVDALIFSDLK